MKTTIIGVLGLLATVLAALAGEFGGIGVTFLDRKISSEPLRTWIVLPNSPAERAGLKPQWYLISVDGTNVVSMSLTQAMSIVRGPVGTSVSLELADAAMVGTNKFTLKRERVVISKDKIEVLPK